MGTVVGDVIFNRNGHPVLVRDQNPKTGEVFLDGDKEKVRNEVRHGIIRGLESASRTQLQDILDETGDSDSVNAGIDSLHARIKELKAASADPRLVKYLEAELQHRMAQAQYTPRDYGFDRFVLKG